MQDNIIPFKCAADVRYKYPQSWNVTTGKWGQVCKKTFGPFIATTLWFYGQEVRWRIKEISVSADKNNEFHKEFIPRSAGQAATTLAARNHIEEKVLPRLLTVYERRMSRLAQEVEKHVG